MSKTNFFIGPTLGEHDDIILYCLDSDESSMIHSENKLSNKAQLADKEYIKNNSAFTLSVIPATKPKDHIIIDEMYRENPIFLEWQFKIYNKLSLPITSNIYYASAKGFAQLARQLIHQKKINTLSVIGYSHLLSKYFDVKKNLDISRKVNSKTHLLELSKLYQIPIPPSKVLSSNKVRKMSALSDFNLSTKAVYLKMNGLGGGYNVSKLTTDKDLSDYINELPYLEENILAQTAVTSKMIEKEHIFIVRKHSSEYLYSSVQLTKGNSWYGNVFIKGDKLNELQYFSLQKAIKALQSEGYYSDKGMLVGFDTKLNQQEIFILEINARWLGSLPVERLLRNLGILNKETVFSSFDYISENEFSKYMSFSEEYLYGYSKESFSIIPISYSAYLTKGQRLVCFAVIGSMQDFEMHCKSLFGKNSFTMLENSMYQIKKHQLCPE